MENDRSEKRMRANENLDFFFFLRGRAEGHGQAFMKSFLYAKTVQTV